MFRVASRLMTKYLRHLPCWEETIPNQSLMLQIYHRNERWKTTKIFVIYDKFLRIIMTLKSHLCKGNAEKKIEYPVDNSINCLKNQKKNEKKKVAK